MPPLPGSIWIFHRGALGDSVILWPVLRAMKAAEINVTLVSDREKAYLAGVELGIAAVDIEQARFNQMWMPLGLIEVVPGVDLVVSFVADGRDGVWAQNASRAFPGAKIRVLGRRPDQRLVRHLIFARPLTPFTRSAGVSFAVRSFVPGAMAEPRSNPGGPIVLHVGAGSEAKRWPLDRWGMLAAHLRQRGKIVDILAGEVEVERFTPEEVALFAQMGGRFLHSLDELAQKLRAASLVVGADSGPTHLAAALGIPTAALFGPTDTNRWLPFGPQVIDLSPAKGPKPMHQIAAGDVCSVITSYLDGER